GGRRGHHVAVALEVAHEAVKFLDVGHHDLLVEHRHLAAVGHGDHVRLGVGYALAPTGRGDHRGLPVVHRVGPGSLLERGLGQTGCGGVLLEDGVVVGGDAVDHRVHHGEALAVSVLLDEAAAGVAAAAGGGEFPGREVDHGVRAAHVVGLA